MAFIVVPVDIDSFDHEFSMELDKVVFLLRFKYNERAGRWAMDVKQGDGTLLVGGVALVTNYPLLARFKDERLPLGDLFVEDTTGGSAEPTGPAWGNTHKLVYREALDA